MDRLLLVRHAPTASTRRACFPLTNGSCAAAGCEPLDRRGARAAAALRGRLPEADHCWASFAARTLETARRAGFAPQPCADLAEGDFGRWAGRTAAELAEAGEAPALAAWRADVHTAPHGGEGFDDVRVRAAKVLLRARESGGTVVAFTHGGLVRAALLEVLGLPSSALWRFDVAPASVTELHPAPEGWRILSTNWTPAGGREPT